MLRLLIVVTVMLMAGCSTMARVPTAQQGIEVLPSPWTLTGKMATKGLGAAVFRWQQDGSDTVIHISGPLGAGAAKVAYMQGELSVQTGEQTLQQQDAEYWLYLNGLSVPFDALAYWVQGLPFGSRGLVMNDAGRFSQAGWDLEVRGWQWEQCHHLPSKMRVSQGDITLKLGAMRWQLPESQVGGPSLFSSIDDNSCENES